MTKKIIDKSDHKSIDYCNSINYQILTIPNQQQKCNVLKLWIFNSFSPKNYVPGL